MLSFLISHDYPCSTNIGKLSWEEKCSVIFGCIYLCIYAVPMYCIHCVKKFQDMDWIEGKEVEDEKAFRKQDRGACGKVERTKILWCCWQLLRRYGTRLVKLPKPSSYKPKILACSRATGHKIFQDVHALKSESTCWTHYSINSLSLGVAFKLPRSHIQLTSHHLATPDIQI